MLAGRQITLHNQIQPNCKKRERAVCDCVSNAFVCSTFLYLVSRILVSPFGKVLVALFDYTFRFVLLK